MNRVRGGYVSIFVLNERAVQPTLNFNKSSSSLIEI